MRVQVRLDATQDEVGIIYELRVSDGGRTVASRCR
jgi:hypothetical protein